MESIPKTNHWIKISVEEIDAEIILFIVSLLFKMWLFTSFCCFHVNGIVIFQQLRYIYYFDNIADMTFSVV